MKSIKQMPSEDLVQRCRAGDSAAQRQLYDRYAPRVHRMALRFVDVSEAEDMVQQVFFRVFTAIGQFAGKSSFDTWLFRIAINECLQSIRKSGRQPITSELCESELAKPDDTDSIADRELLEHALSRLDFDHRCLFLLRETEGMSYREIGETLDISEGTVASRLNRARRELRKTLLKLGWEE